MINRLRVVSLAFALWLPQRAVAGEISTLSGTYGLVRERSDDVDKAIDGAITGMLFFVQPYARNRLHKINPVYQRIAIDLVGNEVVVIADDSPAVRSPCSGETAAWKREDGEPFNVSAVCDSRAFEQTFVSGTGRRVNGFRLSDDRQSLTMEVAVSGGGLPGVLAYQLVYRRLS